MAIVKKTKPSHPAVRWINAKPARLIVMSFLLVILTGTLLLALPFAAQGRRSIGLLGALFTATSATCVTGLVVVDTATYWSTFGKGVILGLIQIGGLGLVTITSFFYSLVRRKARLKTLVVAQESTANFSFNDVLRLIRRIVLITFSIEFVGGVLLTWRFSRYMTFGRALTRGFFQSVSAFCNAGFDLHGDSAAGPYSSLVGWNNEPFVILVTALLFIVGGLGFVVWSDLLRYKREHRLHFHTKLVLIMTVVLIAFGFIFFLIAEFDNARSAYSMGSLPVWQRPFAAFFQSVTPRTAGFNTIDQASMHDSSKFMTIILMFIGAAPGSTGGGVKITTFAVLMATIFSDIRSFDDIILIRHKIARETFTRALAIVGLGLTIIIAVTMILSVVERQALDMGNFSFLDLLYESTSAFGTVGLSSIGTPNLTTAGQMVLIPVMYLGRVGPASFAISLAMHKSVRRELVPPEGKTLVG
ncbi:MAG: potassium transporter TrkG [Eubacteriales bacterium]|nr:potassium transporter TrkG [Eubacteriales bacterium]